MFHHYNSIDPGTPSPPSCCDGHADAQHPDGAQAAHQGAQQTAEGDLASNVLLVKIGASLMNNDEKR